MRLVVPEVERRRQLAALALTNCTLYFLTKWLAFILSSMLEPLEDPVGLGDQRLADVEAREALALEELDRQPCWASRVETVQPAGPPPMTTTSVEVVIWMLLRAGIGGRLARVSKSRGYRMARVADVPPSRVQLATSAHSRRDARAAADGRLPSGSAMRSSNAFPRTGQ